MELATPIFLASDFGYIPEEHTKEEALSLLEEIVKMLYVMIKK